MTEREIRSFLSKFCFFPASRFDLKRFCFENDFRPYDVDHILFDDKTFRFNFVFKKYFKYESLSFTNLSFLLYILPKYEV